MWHDTEAPAPKCSKLNEDVIAFPGGFLGIQSADTAGTRKRKHPVDISMGKVVDLDSLNLTELCDYADLLRKEFLKITMEFYDGKTYKTLRRVFRSAPIPKMKFLLRFQSIRTFLIRNATIRHL